MSTDISIVPIFMWPFLCYKHSHHSLSQATNNGLPDGSMISAWAIMIFQELEGFNCCTLWLKFTPQLSPQFSVIDGKGLSAHGRELAWEQQADMPAQASQPHHTKIHREHLGHRRTKKENWEHAVSLPALSPFTDGVTASGHSMAEIKRPGILLLGPINHFLGQIWRPNLKVLTLALLDSVI